MHILGGSRLMVWEPPIMFSAYAIIDMVYSVYNVIKFYVKANKDAIQKPTTLKLYMLLCNLDMLVGRTSQLYESITYYRFVQTVYCAHNIGILHNHNLIL